MSAIFTFGIPSHVMIKQAMCFSVNNVQCFCKTQNITLYLIANSTSRANVMFTASLMIVHGERLSMSFNLFETLLILQLLKLAK